jgi:hypothetical protein
MSDTPSDWLFSTANPIGVVCQQIACTPLEKLSSFRGACGFTQAEPGIGFCKPAKHQTDSGFRPQKARAAPE